MEHLNDVPVEDATSESVADETCEPIAIELSALVADQSTEPVADAVNEQSNASEVNNNYEVDDESDDDSEVSLVEEEHGSDVENHDRCDPNGDNSIVVLSFDEENGLTRTGRYYRDNQWGLNPNGTIAFQDWQIIGNAKMTREVIKLYAIQEGFRLKKIKNDKYRYTMVYENETCDWRLHASCLTDGVTFMIKSVLCSHSMCTRVTKNNETTSMAKRIVLENLKPDHTKAYGKLRQYGNEIHVTNLRSDVFVAMNPNVVSNNLTFFRFYLSFSVCKTGFVNGCPMIGVDGCHLTCQFEGVLLSATAIDRNSCIVPIALSTFKNHKINGKLWHAVRVANHGCFNEAMASIRSENAKAPDWLMLEPVENWARHGFDINIKSDHITTNMSECFNSWIKDKRDKPVLQLLEHLRRKIMVRFCEKWDKVEKLNDSITPYARETLVTNEYEARKLQVIHGRGEWYGTIEKYGKKFLVNVSNVTCDCGMWQISGLPSWRTAYSGNINPMPEESMWLEIRSEINKPPIKRTKVDIPKKNIRRAIDEPCAPDATFSKRCSTCLEIGHNSRTCPTKENGKQSTSKGKKASKKGTNTSASTSVRAQTNECSTTTTPLTHVDDVCLQIGSHPKP
ncbi:hypothetical protein Ddye_029392 [Dipteronia dyeriana]|uniref:Transposase MuDR plant domain-containing protein n=1 Tax=Dipteronia dyeriana TaxID=168575 RepID=A0AAD9TFL8_9ROSI|nr:hypothetical protein Ddye_029392 [Dipteronia dyeriana]